MEQQRTTRGYSQGSEHRFLTTNYTNLHEWVPRGARNGKKKTTTGTTINNKGQQWTTKHRQSTPAVIAEASRSTRYGTWSVAETAIRDLQTQTPRGVLARLGKKKTTTKTTINNKGQQMGFLAGLGKKGCQRLS